MYLIINSCNDGCPDSHADGEASMEVLMEEEGLDNGREEEENSIDIATPIRITLVLGEVDHQPANMCTRVQCM